MTTTATTPLLDELAHLDPTHPPTPREARELCRRAKAAHRFDVLPSWLISVARRNNTYNTPTTAPTPTPTPPTPANTEKLLKAKAETSGIALPVLRQVFKRGLCEASAAKLPTDPYEYAQARVNSFIRLYQGDCQAREDDADLLGVAL